MDRVDSVDDLSHEWPPDVLKYESRFFLGMTMQEMFLIAAPGIGLMLVAGLVAGAGGFVLGFLAVKRFEALGGRQLPMYFAARLLHALKSDKAITLPLIMPAGGEALVLETWEGDEMLRIEG